MTNPFLPRWLEHNCRKLGNLDWHIFPYLALNSSKGIKPKFLILLATPTGFRTRDPQIRNLVLYPTELRGLQLSRLCIAELQACGQLRISWARRASERKGSAPIR